MVYNQNKGNEANNAFESFQGSSNKMGLKTDETSSFPQIEKPVRVFVSSTWRERKIDVTEIANKLSKQTNASGQLIFDVWRNESGLAEQLTRELADAILDTDLVIIFANDNYQASKMSECEVTYAMKVKKRLLVVKMADELSQGWLDYLMSGLTSVNYPEYHPVDMAYKDILDQINHMFAPPPPPSKISALTRPLTHRLLVQANSSANKPIKERLKMGLNNCRYRVRASIYGFLLFNPEAHVHLLDLAVIWGADSIDVARQLIDTINTTFQCCYYDKTMETVVLQPMFFAAALDKAKEDWKLNGINDDHLCHEQIRFMIAMGAARISAAQQNQAAQQKSDLISSSSEEIMVFQAVRKQRRHVVEQIIRVLSSSLLAEICCMKSKHGKHSCMTFLHFLYHFDWWDDVKPVAGVHLGCKHSYRLLSKILLKLREEGMDLSQPFKPANWFDSSGDYGEQGIVILTEPNHHGTCLIGDVLKDADKDDQHWERASVIDLLAPWKHAYHEGEWVNRLLMDNNTSLQIIAAIKGATSTGEVEAFMTETNAKQDVINATMLTAARVGNIAYFSYLFKQKPEYQKAAFEAKNEHGRNSLMLAASNGHISIVQFIVANAPNVEELIRATDNYGETAVMMTAANGYLAVLKLLATGRQILLKMRNKENQTALSLAVESGHLEIVEFLFYEYSHALSFVDKSGLTVLMVAAKKGHISVVDFLYRKKKSSLIPSEMTTALTLAANHGHLETVEYLYDRLTITVGTLPTDIYGQSPLMIAAARGHLSIVEFFVSKDEEAIRQKDEQGQTTLLLASANGHLAVVKFLHEKFDLAIRWHDLQYRWPLLAAANNGHYEVALYLCKKYPDATKFCNSLGRNPLMLAASNNHRQILAMLYNFNSSAVKTGDRDGKTAMILAAENGCFDAVKFFCENCNSIVNTADEAGRTAFMTAALSGHADIVQYLYSDEAASKVDNNKQNVFLLAAFGGNVDILKFLCLKSPRSPPQKDKNGRSAVMLAAMNGKLDAVRFLTSDAMIYSDPLDDVDNSGASAMMLAAMNGHVEVVEALHALLPGGTEMADANGQTALILSAASGHMEVVKFLCDKPRESVMLRDKNDRTALMVAAQNGHGDLVEFLYSRYNFAVNVSDKQGYTALMLAKMNGHIDIVRFIHDKTKRIISDA